MLTIEPPPRVFIDRTASCRQQERRAQVDRHHRVPLNSTVASSSEARAVVAALFTRMSMPPRRVDHVADDLAAGVDVPQIAGDGIDLVTVRRAATSAVDVALARSGPWTTTDAPSVGEMRGDALADAGSRTGDERDLVRGVKA